MTPEQWCGCLGVRVGEASAGDDPEMVLIPGAGGARRQLPGAEQEVLQQLHGRRGLPRVAQQKGKVC